MRPLRHRRLFLLYACGILSFLGLLAVTYAMSGPPKKPPAFPLSLFAQAQADDYIDEAMCKECHKASHTTFENSPHAPYVANPRFPTEKRGCQSCHGPGGPHISHLKDEDKPFEYVISYTKAKPAEAAAACLRCHNDTLTEAHWKRNEHARANVTCTACHQMHWPDRLGQNQTREPGAEEKEAGRGVVSGARTGIRSPVFTAGRDPKAMLKADEATLCGKCHKRETTEFRHNFHHPVPEGRMVCSDCHTVHPDRNTQKRFRTAKQNCITCHGDIAGPFVYEHDPTSDQSTEGCIECHRPHGSHNPKLVKTFSRGLCITCHSDKSNNHFPGRTCWQAGCHAAIHGSNHDPNLLRR